MRVVWDDVGGLWEVKKVLLRIIGFYFVRVFGKFEFWKGIFLFGLFGIGKSFLVSVVVGSFGVMFLNVKVSDVLSKYFGELFKFVVFIYYFVREKSFSIVFIDEFDVLVMKCFFFEDVVRRVFLIFFVEIDGFKCLDINECVVIFVVMNWLWDFDDVIFFRFFFRVYVLFFDESFVVEILRIYLFGFRVKVNLRVVVKEVVRWRYLGRDFVNFVRLVIIKMLSDMNFEFLEF